MASSGSSGAQLEIPRVGSRASNRLRQVVGASGSVAVRQPDIHTDHGTAREYGSALLTGRSWAGTGSLILCRARGFSGVCRWWFARFGSSLRVCVPIGGACIDVAVSAHLGHRI